jgi:exonuclease III
MANLNINSLLKSIDQLRAIMVNTPLDILSINETKIDDSLPDNEISITGYHLIRKDRNRLGGGGGCLCISASQYHSLNEMT